jgi:hypothetical protein
MRDFDDLWIEKWGEILVEKRYWVSVGVAGSYTEPPYNVLSKKAPHLQIGDELRFPTDFLIILDKPKTV